MGKIINAYFLLLTITIFFSVSISLAQNNEEVLAIIGNETITIEDLTLTWQQAYPLILALYKGEQGKERLFQELLDRKLFSQESYRLELDKEPIIRKKIVSAIEKVLSDELIEQTISSLRTPSESEMIKYYEKNKPAFQENEQVQIRKIYLKTEKEANEVLNLINDGVDFDKLAYERCSECAKKNFRQATWVSKGRMSPQLEKAAFALEKGDVSEILRTDTGFYLIKCEDKREARTQMFFEVKDNIKNKLFIEKKEQLIEAKRDELKRRYGVQTFPERLSQVEFTSFKTINSEKDFIDTMQKRSLLDLVK